MTKANVGDVVVITNTRLCEGEQERHVVEAIEGGLYRVRGESGSAGSVYAEDFEVIERGEQDDD